MGSHATARSVRDATSLLPAPDQLPRQPLVEGVVMLLAGDLDQGEGKLDHAVRTRMPCSSCTPT